MVLMKNNILTLVLLTLVSALMGITSPELYGQLMAKYDKIITFQADIVQTSFYSEIDHINISEGEILYNSDKILINYTSPKEEKISLIENTVYIYQAEPDRLIKTYADSSFVSLNIKHLIKRVWNDQAIEITEQEDSYLVKTKLSEAKQFANIVLIEFLIDMKDYMVKNVKYQDDSSNEVSVSFSNIKLNKEIADDVWEMDLSDNTQIIDYRE